MLCKRSLRVCAIITAIIIFSIPTYADVNVMYDLSAGANLYNSLRNARITATSYYIDNTEQDLTRYSTEDVVSLNGGKVNIKLYVPDDLTINNDTELIGLNIPLSMNVPTEGFYKQIVLSNVDINMPYTSYVKRIGIRWRMSNATDFYTYIDASEFPTPPQGGSEWGEDVYQKIGSLFFDVPSGAIRITSLIFDLYGGDTWFNDYNLSIDNTKYFIEMYGFCYTTYDGYDPLKQEISNNFDDLVNFTPTPEPPEYTINSEEGEIFDNLGSSVGDFNFDFAPTDVTFLQSGEIFRTIYEGLNEMNGFEIFMGFACLCCVLKVVIT